MTTCEYFSNKTKQEQKLYHEGMLATINMSAASVNFRNSCLSFYEARGYLTDKQLAVLRNAKHRVRTTRRSYMDNLDHDQACDWSGEEGSCYWGS